MSRAPQTIALALLSVHTLLVACTHTPARGMGDTAARPPTARDPKVFTESDLRDRIRGAWLGQMIGVTWGFPTEFYARYIDHLFPEFHQVDGVPTNLYAPYEGGMIPLDELPEWNPEMINGGYTQDDLYGEVPFMRAMREYGVNASWNDLGDAFANSQFPLYHANLAARDNLRAGIAPPMSGHFQHNGHADDIDWQIEADFVGLMTPGMPNAAADIAFRAGHIMNYGDGVLGGVFVATMISEAFIASSVESIALAGTRAVPEGTGYRAVLDEVWRDWEGGIAYEDSVRGLYERWGGVDRCEEWAGEHDPLNIDAKLNGAFILLGLLYGEGDIADSMRYAMAAGQDSDCNPSNVGSVLGAYYGAHQLAQDGTDWLSALDTSTRFQTTGSTLDELVELNLELARGVVLMRGGTAEPDGAWSIPQDAARVTVPAEQWPAEENDAPRLWVEIEQDRDTIRVHANARDDNGITGYHCFFGDLTHAPGALHEHRYREPGNYELTIFVIDTTGNSSWESVNISIPHAQYEGG